MSPCVKRQLVQGFTMVESVFGALIVISVFLILGTLVRAANDGIGTINTQGALDIQLSQATQALHRDIGLAVRAVGSCCSGTHTATLGSPTGVNSKLILELYSVDSAGRVLDPNTYDYVIYQHFDASSTLGRIVEANAVSARPNTYVQDEAPAPAGRSVSIALRLAQAAGNWLMPPAAAMGSVPPPPSGLSQHWYGIKAFTYSVNPSGTTGDQFVTVQLNGALQSTAGHTFMNTLRLHLVFRGKGTQP